jgi:YD repeat-containing protein
MPKTITLGVYAALCVGARAHAAETITFTYDPLGRLTHVQTTGGPSNGVTREYRYDATDNRTQFLLTGAPGFGSVTITPLGSVANVTSVGVTIAVNIIGSPPSGTVTFTENGVFLGTAFVNGGQASINLEGFPAGLHAITATYSGDGANAP